MSRMSLFLSVALILALGVVPLLLEHFGGNRRWLRWPRGLAWPRRTWAFLVAGPLLALVAGLLLIEKMPVGVAFCAQCGAARESTDWRLRATPLVLWRSAHTTSTPFSSLLSARQLAAAHAHRWLEPRTVPNPLDPWGAKVIESLGYLNAPRILSFTRNLADFADPQSRLAWRDRLLDPAYSYVFDDALRFQRAPQDGFADRASFLRWWGANSFALANKLREQTEPD